MKKCWWPLRDITGSTLVASMYSVPLYLSANAAKQETLLNVPDGSSNVGSLSSGIS